MRVIWPTGTYYPLHVGLITRYMFLFLGCDSVLFVVLHNRTWVKQRPTAWTEQMLAVVKDSMSQRDAAENFKIPRTT